MKKFLIPAVILTALCINSCSKENLVQDENQNNNNSEIEIVYNHKAKLKKDFAKALVHALADNTELRLFIKNEALKKFDHDYDILYHMVKDQKLSNGLSFKEILLKYFDNTSRLTEIEDNLPLLTIFVPELPENSFSAESWDVTAEIPEVAIRLTTSNHVPMFTTEKEYILKAGNIPGFPVVVIKENERLVVNNINSKSIKGINGSALKSLNNDMEFRFLDDIFNNTVKKANKTKSNHTARIANNLDQKLIDAYNTYKNADGWQRDYIYYNLTPSNTKDQFQYDFQEHIAEFSLIGNPEAAYNKISDQTGDPEYRDWRKFNQSNWTGGSFEFKVRVLINGRNGVGEELTTYFSANPEQLFNLNYQSKFGGYIFIFKSISIKSMPINLPLFNWDLNQYASSIKIEIEEVDLTETTVLTDTRSVKFANNFSIDPTDGIFKKVGLKFGSSLETNTTQTIQRTFTQGNDQLGSVIINFADDVVLTHSTTNNQSTTRDYQTGWYKISVEPKRVQ